MKNKVTLIISDIHHRWQEAEKIIASVPHDEVLFLGDFFDDFDDTPEMVQATSDWLVSSVAKSNRIHLFGNHDVHYAFTYRSFVCAGYEQWKYFIIHDTLPREVWDKLKWYHILDNTWLVTHAGLHNFNLPDRIAKLSNDRPTFLKEIGKHLDSEIVNGFRAAANKTPHWIFNAGYSRGGTQRVGGITWCDFEREFYPIRGLNQILGHTPQALGFAKWCVMDKDNEISYLPCNMFTPRKKDISDSSRSFNIDLDVYKNTHYAVWDGNKLSVRRCVDL